MGVVLTESAEGARSSAMLVVGLHERTMRCLRDDAKRPWGRLRRPTETGHLLQMHHAAITQLVAIAEEFARSAIDSRLSLLEGQYGGITRRLLREVRSQGDETWERVRNLYKLTQLPLNDAPADQAFQGFVEARNCIAHGLGRLTPKQLRKRDRTVSMLHHAGITTASDRLVVDPTTVDNCATTIAQWIEWIDARAGTLPLC